MSETLPAQPKGEDNTPCPKEAEQSPPLSTGIPLIREPEPDFTPLLGPDVRVVQEGELVVTEIPIPDNMTPLLIPASLPSDEELEKFILFPPLNTDAATSTSTSVSEVDADDVDAINEKSTSSQRIPLVGAVASVLNKIWRGITFQGVASGATSTASSPAEKKVDKKFLSPPSSSSRHRDRGPSAVVLNNGILSKTDKIVVASTESIPSYMSSPPSENTDTNNGGVEQTCEVNNASTYPATVYSYEGVGSAVPMVPSPLPTATDVPSKSERRWKIAKSFQFLRQKLYVPFIGRSNPKRHRLSADQRSGIQKKKDEKRQQANHSAVQSETESMADESSVSEVEPGDVSGNESEIQMALQLREMNFSTLFTITCKVTLDDFNVVKMIGRGDVGRVYLVNLKSTDQLYAMKVLSKNDMIVRNKVKRVLTEREILASANHPFIVTLLHSFQSKCRLYFVMEYCAGGEFFRFLQKQPGKCIDEEAARFYAAEGYVMVMVVIMLDLKPENILLHESGHVMLSDFDLSKAAAMTPLPHFRKKSFFETKPADIVTKPLLRTNSFVGTEEYLAPEVIQGYGHSAEVDWWTFGILLYEMLYGFTPFRGNSRDETFRNVLEMDLKFPDTPHVSSACKNLIRKLLCQADKRLGTVNGASDIKKHHWFRGHVNWALIRNVSAPMRPTISNPQDTSNFKPLKEDEDELHLMMQDAILTDAEVGDVSNPFHDFDSISRAPSSPINKGVVRRQTDHLRDDTIEGPPLAVPLKKYLGTSTPGPEPGPEIETSTSTQQMSDVEITRLPVTPPNLSPRSSPVPGPAT